MEQDRDERGEGEVTEADLQRLQDAHPHDPKQGRDSAETLNKPTDPSLNDRDAPVAKGVGNY